MCVCVFNYVDELINEVKKFEEHVCMCVCVCVFNYLDELNNEAEKLEEHVFVCVCVYVFMTLSIKRTCTYFYVDSCECIYECACLYACVRVRMRWVIYVHA